MNGKIHLYFTEKGAGKTDWDLGEVLSDGNDVMDPAHVESMLARFPATDWCLFWDPALPLPDPAVLARLADRPVDVFHAGLVLKQGNLPIAFKFVVPAWMLRAAGDPDREVTSWQVSLRACLLRLEVVQKLGFVRAGFDRTDTAALEAGLRWIRRGAIIRHTPELLATSSTAANAVPLGLDDELRFIVLSSGKKWACWAAWRILWLRMVPTWRILGALFRVCRISGQPMVAPMRGELPLSSIAWTPDEPGNGDLAQTRRSSEPRVTVLIPTINRYPYLRILLAQLREQTIPPHEVIVIDQTSRADRNPGIYEEFVDLPLKVIYHDEAGQCTSRNAGLLEATGEFIALLDDDVEIRRNYLEVHLETLRRFNADASSGICEETGAGPVPPGFRFLRVSDVFPAGITVLKKAALVRTGLFDPGFNKGARADADLGYRLYCEGSLLMLNPEICVLHHRAPMGGLRTHHARVVTFAASRFKLTKRSLPSATELYLILKHFDEASMKEHVYRALVSSFGIRGGVGRRLGKAFVATIQLPDSVRKLRTAMKAARELAASSKEPPNLRASSVVVDGRPLAR